MPAHTRKRKITCWPYAKNKSLRPATNKKLANAPMYKSTYNPGVWQRIQKKHAKKSGSDFPVNVVLTPRKPAAYYAPKCHATGHISHSGIVDEKRLNILEKMRAGKTPTESEREWLDEHFPPHPIACNIATRKLYYVQVAWEVHVFVTIRSQIRDTNRYHEKTVYMAVSEYLARKNSDGYVYE